MKNVEDLRVHPNCRDEDLFTLRVDSGVKGRNFFLQLKLSNANILVHINLDWLSHQSYDQLKTFHEKTNNSSTL